MHALRCKPGDLAVVIHAMHPENIGRIVQVIRQDNGKGPLRFHPNQNAWLVESNENMSWHVKEKLYRRKRGPVPDAQLQPIRDLTPGEELSELHADHDLCEP